MTANRDLANGKSSGRDVAGSLEVQQPGVSLLLVAPADVGRSALLAAWIRAVEKLADSQRPIEILNLSYGGETPASSALGSSIEVHHLHASDRASVEHRGILEARGAQVVLIDIERVVCTDDLDLLLAAVQRHSRVAGRSIDRAGPWGARLRRMWIDGIVRWVGGTGLGDASCGIEAFENRRAMVVSQGGLRGRLQRVLLDRDRGTKAVEVPLRTGEIAESEEGREGWRGVAALTIWVLRNAWQHRWFPRREPATRGRIDLRASRWSSVLVSAVLLLGFAGLLIGRLDFALVEPDETRNVQIGLEMARSGDFVLPTRHGDPYLDKPAMLFWAMATSFRWFGESAWAARLPVALACWGTVAAIVLLGGARLGRAAGWIGGALLATSIGFTLLGRFVVTDALLTCFVAWGALSLHRGTVCGSWRRVWWLIAGAALGAGILTKGPVAPVLVLPPWLVWMWLEGRFTRREIGSSIWWIVPMIAIPLPWFLSIVLREPEHFRHFFWEHNVLRYTQAFNHQEPWWFYVPVLFLGMFPASLLIPSLVLHVTSRDRRLRGVRSSDEGYLWLWACWVIGFFSLSACKLPTYIVPALPPLALLMGRFVSVVLLSRAAAGARLPHAYLRHLAKWLPWQVLAVMIVILVGAAIVEIALTRQVTSFDVAQWGLIAIAGMLAYLLTVPRGGVFQAKWLATGVMGTLVLGYIFQDVYADGAGYRSTFPEAMAELSRLDRDRDGDRDDTETPLVWFGRLSDSISLSIGRTPRHAFSETQVLELYRFIKSHPESTILAIPRHAALLDDKIPIDARVQPIGESGLVWRVEPESAASSSARVSLRDREWVRSSVAR